MNSSAKSPNSPNKKIGAKFWSVFILALIGTFLYHRHQADRPTTPEAPKELNIFAFSDYFPEPLLRSFEQKHGIKVRYDVYSSNEELLAKLQAGATGYDLIVPSDYMVRTLIQLNLVQELNKEKIKNLENLAPEFQDNSYDPGAKFSVPYTWGTTGLIYDATKVKTPPESWQDIFKPEYAGRISLLDDVREVMGAMLRLEGHSANTTDQAALKLAQERLKKLKPSIKLFSSDPKQHVLNGDIWIAHVYSGDANQLMRENPNLKYVVPNEGGVIWIDNFAIPKSAPNPEMAHAFIDEMLNPETAKAITEELLYASPNQAIEKLLAEEDLLPRQIKKMKKGQLEFLEDLGTTTEYIDQLWSEARAL